MATIEMSPDAVNKLVADAILDSALGTHLRSLVEKQLVDLRGSYNNPIEAALRTEVFRVVERLVKDEYTAKIEAVVREKLTDELMSTVALSAWNLLADTVEKHRYR